MAQGRFVIRCVCHVPCTSEERFLRRGSPPYWYSWISWRLVSEIFEEDYSCQKATNSWSNSNHLLSRRLCARESRSGTNLLGQLRAAVDDAVRCTGPIGKDHTSDRWQCPSVCGPNVRLPCASFPTFNGRTVCEPLQEVIGSLRPKRVGEQNGERPLVLQGGQSQSRSKVTTGG